jgi:acyl carrier protein phosphodiesterase
MNWLAHLYLSEPTAAFRIGSILPDFAAPAALASMPAEYQGGIERHRIVDAFSDSHPALRRSVGRFAPPFRRFGGILADVFHDHFLSRDWARFSDQPLADFAEEVYAAIEARWDDLPPDSHPRLGSMRMANWLCLYGDLDGIARVLERMGTRLRRPFDLGAATAVLERDYEGFRADFEELFPAVRERVRQGSSWTR